MTLVALQPKNTVISANTTGVVIVGGLLTELVSFGVEKARLTGANRALGLLFGLARGLVVVGVLTVFARILELPREPWWSEAKLIPFAERIAAGLEAMLPDAVIEHMPMPDASAEQPA